MSFKTDANVYARLLQSCTESKSLAEGKLVHAHMNITGFQPQLFIQNSLVNLYAKCGSIVDAHQMFDKMPVRTVFSWNSLLSGYANSGNLECARYLFDSMPLRNLFSWNLMLEGYVKHGSVDIARNLFDEMPERDTVSWTTMVAGYSQHGFGEEALQLFKQMLQAGTKPNQFTFASILKVCVTMSSLDQAKQVHLQIQRSGFESNVFVGSTLVDVYNKCGSMEDAHKVFDKMHQCNVVSWTAMMAGYVQNGHDEKALELFCQMQLANTRPDHFTLATALSACASIAALERGKQIHAHLIKVRLESHVCVGNTVITMYAKCGSIANAVQAFGQMPERDGVSWTAMIAGYAQHGHGNEALELYEQMLQAGRKPDHVTFVGILNACSHSGLVDAGYHYFGSMSRDYCISPRAEHYACMIDLLGRSGRVEEAEIFINNMPFEPDAHVWGALLGACRMHGNVELAACASEYLFELDPLNPATYVLLSNIYAETGRWDDVARVRKLMKDRGVQKKPGWSWIEVKNKVHTFTAGDRSHPQMSEIYEFLEKLAMKMKDAGYMPDMKYVLHDVEEEDKEYHLYHHSEKLAIAFGLISTVTGTPIQIVKNIRVCHDCHVSIKFISQIVGREITVRDANRFHHFKDGICSCSDYW
jgi:pentatricopeptide repeat protein